LHFVLIGVTSIFNLLMSFSYAHDFDENGLLYWIGTNGKTALDWVNPAQYGLVVVTSSEGRNLPYGRLEDILSRDTGIWRVF
jgi:E3 ubiquitin-protein ligase HECTD1